MNDEKPIVVDDVAAVDPVPFGKVLIDGKLVDRTKCILPLAKKEGTNLERALDGTTYQRQKDGSLRRVTIKKKKRHQRRHV